MSEKSHSTPGPLALPALRCRMGDRGDFITAMNMKEVAARVKDVAEVHSSPKLRDWIQRRLTDKHAVAISNYLISEESRFFNALVIGVYGGDVKWGSLRVEDPRDELLPEDEVRINETLGVLTLTGSEQLFPIDGQHRVAGIKKAVRDKPQLAGEEITVLLVAHGRTEEGKTRTRRLFVRLNQSARRVSQRDIVALDEDNALAVVTRRMIDEYEPFQANGIISFSGNVAIPESDTKAITSILGLYQIVKGLYPRSGDEWPKMSKIQRSRFEDFLEPIYAFYVDYWETLIRVVPEYRAVLADKKKDASYYRSGTKNHLLFRPVGQLAFARAVEALLAKDMSVANAVRLLHSKNEMSLLNDDWKHILWDPVAKKMLNNWSPAEALLLTKAGHEPRTEKAKQRLRQLQRGSSD